MKQISPITSWLNGKSVSATILNMSPNSGVLGTSATFYYALLDASETVVARGYITMSGEAYSNWGNNDEYAWNWAAAPEQLNLTIIGDYNPSI